MARDGHGMGTGWARDGHGGLLTVLGGGSTDVVTNNSMFGLQISSWRISAQVSDYMV